MININNNIDYNFRARIYYKDKFIGECLNELAFLDVRCQIKEECDENYSFELIKTNLDSGKDETSKRFKFSKNGNIQWNREVSNFYWYSHDHILGKLLEL